MQASTSSVAVVSPEFALARVCSLKYAAKALLWTSVVRSETTPLIIRSWAHKGELPIAGQQRGNEFHIAEHRDGTQFRANLLPEEFPELLTQSDHHEAPFPLRRGVAR